jgi:hypothetical protein
VAGDVSIGDRVQAFIGWVFLPVMGLIILVVQLHDLPGALDARHGHGVPGTFTVTRHDCTQIKGRRVCDWYGNFVSDSGSKRLTNILWLDDADRVGQVIPAVSEGNDAYSAKASTAWKFAVEVIAACLVGLLIWAVAVWRKLRKRRSSYKRTSADAIGLAGQ